MNQTNEAKIFPPEFENGGTTIQDPSDRPRSTEREFRAELSQKLRTPLNAIIGFAELVAMRPGSAIKDPDVQHILRAARDLLEIINNELADPDVPPQKSEPSVVPPISCDILYIEDDLVNFTLVERILEFRPALKLLHAPRGETGIDLAQIHHPKLILLDLNLPDMHGSEVIHRLQSDPTTAQVPVVVLSADATPSQIERLLKGGARNYLTKPFDIDPFLAIVDEMVNERAKTSQPQDALQ
jgi:CheY-like chemotaxis protein